METFGDDSFIRLRVGIGRPTMRQSAANYVLGEFGKDEKAVLHKLLEKAKDAVVTVLCKGAQVGMNEFNNKLIPVEGKTDGGN
jgi:PTH1 family peptidyl-tRNA hydrolase